MGQWEREKADYQVQQAGQHQASFIHIERIFDDTSNEREKIILQDRADNHGPSIEDSPAARDHCITSISKSMSMSPEETEWFIQNREGQIQAVSISYEQVQKEHPSLNSVLNDDNTLSRDKAKEFFPDITVSELRTSLERPDPQSGPEQALTEASSQARDIPSPNQEQDNSQSQKSAHEYDLSHEYFHDR